MVEVTCDACGKRCQTTRWQSEGPHHFCSNECYHRWRKTRTGPLNPNWKGGMVAKTCIQCGMSFEVTRSMASKSKYCSVKCKAQSQRFERRCLNCGNSYQGRLRTFCSYECHLKYRVARPRHCTPETKERIAARNRGKAGLSGTANPMYKEGRNVMAGNICLVCGKHFVAPAYRMYCSRKCMAKDGQRRRDRFMATPEGAAMRKFMSRRMNGKANPRWKDGACLKPYSSDFNPRLKLRILERDRFACRLCGTGESLVIHHIDNSKTNSLPSNLVTLCKSCHSGLHARNETFTIASYGLSVTSTM